MKMRGIKVIAAALFLCVGMIWGENNAWNILPGSRFVSSEEMLIDGDIGSGGDLSGRRAMVTVSVADVVSYGCIYVYCRGKISYVITESGEELGSGILKSDDFRVNQIKLGGKANHGDFLFITFYGEPGKIADVNEMSLYCEMKDSVIKTGNISAKEGSVDFSSRSWEGEKEGSVRAVFEGDKIKGVLSLYVNGAKLSDYSVSAGENGKKDIWINGLNSSKGDKIGLRFHGESGVLGGIELYESYDSAEISNSWVEDVTSGNGQQYTACNIEDGDISTELYGMSAGAKYREIDLYFGNKIYNGVLEMEYTPGYSDRIVFEGIYNDGRISELGILDSSRTSRIGQDVVYKRPNENLSISGKKQFYIDGNGELLKGVRIRLNVNSSNEYGGINEVRILGNGFSKDGFIRISGDMYLTDRSNILRYEDNSITSIRAEGMRKVENAGRLSRFGFRNRISGISSLFEYKEDGELCFIYAAGDVSSLGKGIDLESPAFGVYGSSVVEIKGRTLLPINGITINNGKVSADNERGSGAFKKEIVCPVDGEYFLETASDGVISRVERIYVDRRSPEIYVTAPSGKYIGRSGFVLDGYLKDVTPARVVVNGKEAEVTGRRFSINGTVIGQSKDIIIEAYDRCGRKSVKNYSFEIDNESPVLKVVNPADGYVTKSESVDIEVSVSDITGVILRCRDSEIAVSGTGTYVLKGVHVEPGENEIGIYAEDEAGNIVHELCNVLVDRESPVFNPEIRVSEDKNRIEIGVRDLTATGVEYRINGIYGKAESGTGSERNGSLDLDRRYTIQLPAGTADGAVISLRATDLLGNVSEVERRVMIDAEGDINPAVHASYESSGIRVEWAGEGMERWRDYRVRRVPSFSSGEEKRVESTRYIDNDLISDSDVQYTYYVQGEDGLGGHSEWMSGCTGARKQFVPGKSGSVVYDRMKLSWDGNEYGEGIQLSVSAVSEPGLYRGTGVLCSPIYQFGPEHTRFGESMTISMKADGVSDSQDRLSWCYFNERLNRWEQIPSMYNEKTGEIEGVITHFSLYALKQDRIRNFEDLETSALKSNRADTGVYVTNGDGSVTLSSSDMTFKGPGEYDFVLTRSINSKTLVRNMVSKNPFYGTLVSQNIYDSNGNIKDVKYSTYKSANDAFRKLLDIGGWSTNIPRISGTSIQIDEGVLSIDILKYKISSSSSDKGEKNIIRDKIYCEIYARYDNSTGLMHIIVQLLNGKQYYFKLKSKVSNAHDGIYEDVNFYNNQDIMYFSDSVCMPVSAITYPDNSKLIFETDLDQSKIVMYWAGNTGACLEKSGNYLYNRKTGERVSYDVSKTLMNTIRTTYDSKLNGFYSCILDSASIDYINKSKDLYSVSIDYINSVSYYKDNLAEKYLISYDYGNFVGNKKIDLNKGLSILNTAEVAVAKTGGEKIKITFDLNVNILTSKIFNYIDATHVVRSIERLKSEVGHYKKYYSFILGSKDGSEDDASVAVKTNIRKFNKMIVSSYNTVKGVLDGKITEYTDMDGYKIEVEDEKSLKKLKYKGLLKHLILNFQEESNVYKDDKSFGFVKNEDYYKNNGNCLDIKIKDIINVKISYQTTIVQAYDKNNKHLCTFQYFEPGYFVKGVWGGEIYEESKAEKSDYLPAKRKGFIYSPYDLKIYSDDRYTVYLTMTGSEDVITSLSVYENNATYGLLTEEKSYPKLNDVTSDAVSWNKYEYDSMGRMTCSWDDRGNYQSMKYRADDGTYANGLSCIDEIEIGTYVPAGNQEELSVMGEVSKTLRNSINYSYQGAALNTMASYLYKTRKEVKWKEGSVERSKQEEYGYADIPQTDGSVVRKLNYITSGVNSIVYEYDTAKYDNPLKSVKINGKDDKSYFSKYYEYLEGSGLMKSVSDRSDMSDSISFEYDHLGRNKNILFPDSTAVGYVFDDNNRKYTRSIKAGTEELKREEVSHFDGHVESVKYYKDVSKYIGQDFTYDSLGRKLSGSDFKGNKYTFQYSKGLLSETVTPASANNSIKYTYGFCTVNGIKCSYAEKTDEEGYKSRVIADRYGNTIGSVAESDAGIVGSYAEYNLQGQVVKSKDIVRYMLCENDYTVSDIPGGNGKSGTKTTEITYDDLGRKTGTVTGGIQTDDSTTVTYRESYVYNELDMVVKKVITNGTHSVYTFIEYDPAGNEIRVIENISDNKTDEDARITDLSYDERGNLKEVIYPGSGADNSDRRQHKMFVYDKMNRVTQEILYSAGMDIDGHVTFYEYDGMGRVKDMYDMRAAVMVNGTGLFMSDNMCMLGSNKDKYKTEFKYDMLGRLASVVYADGSTEMAEYDDNGNLLTVVNRMGGETKYYYDVMNRKIFTRSGNSGDYSGEYYTYYDNGMVKEKGVPEIIKGHQSEMGSGAVDGIIAQHANNIGENFTYEYNKTGRLWKVISPTGGVSETSYNEDGTTASSVGPTGAEETYKYYAGGLLKETTLSAEGIVLDNSCYTYTDLQKPSEVYSMADDEKVVRRSYTYDNYGRVTSSKDGGNKTTAYVYNRLDMVTSVNYPDSRVENYEYTGLGQLSVREVKGGSKTLRQTMTYDGVSGAVTGIKSEDGVRGVTQNETYSYDFGGNLYRYDISGSVTFSAEYRHDYALTDGKSSGDDFLKLPESSGYIRYKRDNFGRLTHIGRGDNDYIAKFGYENGNLKSMTSVSGDTATYSYDMMNRIKGVSVENGGNKLVEMGNVYDSGKTENLISQSITAGGKTRTMSCTYDASGRLDKYTMNGIMSYTDTIPMESGRALLSNDHPDFTGGSVTNVSITADTGITKSGGRYSETSIESIESTGGTIEIGYSEDVTDIKVIKIAGTEGINFSSNNLKVYYGGNGEWEEAEISAGGIKSKCGTTVIVLEEKITARKIRIHCRANTSLPLTGRLKDIIHVYRLSAEVNEDFGFDAAQRRTDGEVTHEHMRIKSREGTDYRYDNGGRLVIKTNDEESWIYRYDLDGRLWRVYHSRTNLLLAGNELFDNITDTYDYTGNGFTLAEENVYNASGERVRKITPKTDISYYRTPFGYMGTKEGSKKRYLLEYGIGAGEIETEADTLGGSSQTTTIRFAGQNDSGGLGTAEIEEMTGFSGLKTAIRNYYTDQIGSVRAVSENGEIKWTGDYKAYGELLTEDATNEYMPLKTFALHEHDEETGLIYANQRWLDYTTGSFTTEDPAQSGTNWYSYCNGNPVNLVDPLGLEAENDVYNGDRYDPEDGFDYGVDPTDKGYSPSTTPSSGNEGSKYKVLPGDTITKIAKKIGVTPQALIAANPKLEGRSSADGSLKNEHFIMSGEELNVPGTGEGETPEEKAAGEKNTAGTAEGTKDDVKPTGGETKPDYRGGTTSRTPQTPSGEKPGYFSGRNTFTTGVFDIFHQDYYTVNYEKNPVGSFGKDAFYLLTGAIQGIFNFAFGLVASPFACLEDFRNWIGIDDATIDAVDYSLMAMPPNYYAAASLSLKSLRIYSLSRELLAGSRAVAATKTAGIFTKSSSQNLNVLKDVLNKAKPVNGRLETILDDGTKVIFRRDFGSKAHPIGAKYPNPVNHYNIELHQPFRNGWKQINNGNFHVIVDDVGVIVDFF